MLTPISFRQRCYIELECRRNVILEDEDECNYEIMTRKSQKVIFLKSLVKGGEGLYIEFVIFECFADVKYASNVLKFI